MEPEVEAPQIPQPIQITQSQPLESTVPENTAQEQTANKASSSGWGRGLHARINQPPGLTSTPRDAEPQPAAIDINIPTLIQNPIPESFSVPNPPSASNLPPNPPPAASVHTEIKSKTSSKEYQTPEIDRREGIQNTSSDRFSAPTTPSGFGLKSGRAQNSARPKWGAITEPMDDKHYKSPSVRSPTIEQSRFSRQSNLGPSNRSSRYSRSPIREREGRRDGSMPGDRPSSRKENRPSDSHKHRNDNHREERQRERSPNDFRRDRTSGTESQRNRDEAHRGDKRQQELSLTSRQDKDPAHSQQSFALPPPPSRETSRIPPSQEKFKANETDSGGSRKRRSRWDTTQNADKVGPVDSIQNSGTDKSQEQARLPNSSKEGTLNPFSHLESGKDQLSGGSSSVRGGPIRESKGSHLLSENKERKRRPKFSESAEVLAPEISKIIPSSLSLAQPPLPPVEAVPPPQVSNFSFSAILRPTLSFKHICWA